MAGDTKTFSPGGKSANDIISTLSKLNYSSDYLKDDLGGKSSLISNKNTNWRPNVDTSKPMAKFQFTGRIIGFANPTKTSNSGMEIDGKWYSYKEAENAINEWKKLTGGLSINKQNNAAVNQWMSMTKQKSSNKTIDAEINGSEYISVSTYTGNSYIITGTGWFTGGLPVFKYFKDGNNLYLYSVFSLKDPKTNKYTQYRYWFQVVGVSNSRFSEYSKIYKQTNTKGSTQSATDNSGETIIDDTNVVNTHDIQEDVGDYYDNEADYNGEIEYDKALIASDTEYEKDYWDNLYGSNSEYSLKSHNSIIGLPLQFLPNADFRPGASSYGKQFLEDIIYDMNIACIKPGGPVLNPKWSKDAQYSDDIITGTLNKIGTLKAYFDRLGEVGAGGLLRDVMFTMFRGSSARFYSFQSDYTHYTHYVNTLCHLFITFLGIGDKEYVNQRGTVKKYDEYTDDYREIEKDAGLGMKNQFGFDNGVFLYYSDEGSSLNQNFTNSTMQSGLSNTIQEASNAVKEWGFLINAAGIETGKGIVSLDGIANATVGYSNSVLGRLFSHAAEGGTVILSGRNISLPEIYVDSDTTVQHSFKVKLASPYGDPESIFLYVLRPLARILAFSLPRQFSANSYGSPFIVQAFSKGQFNCQLGIVTELSITRCGNGGESHSINHIPTELEVNLTIADMYDKIFLSNEYYGNSALKSISGAFLDNLTGSHLPSQMIQFFSTSTAAKLLFNNVGLIDFTASLCGFNLNNPTGMNGWHMIKTMMQNRTNEYMVRENDKWLFPQWEKYLNDAFNDASQNLTTPIVTFA